MHAHPRPREIYTRLLHRHLHPAFGATPINRVNSAAVRTWHASLRSRGVGQVTTAKAYRLLKAILNTAVERIRAEAAELLDRLSK